MVSNEKKKKFNSVKHLQEIYIKNDSFFVLIINTTEMM